MLLTKFKHLRRIKKLSRKSSSKTGSGVLRTNSGFGEIKFMFLRAALGSNMEELETYLIRNVSHVLGLNLRDLLILPIYTRFQQLSQQLSNEIKSLRNENLQI